MHQLRFIVLIALTAVIGCNKLQERKNIANPEGKINPSLEADLKRFLARNAPELPPALVFDQEAIDKRLPMINRRSEEKKIEVKGLSSFIKDSITINGVLKSRGGDYPKALKGVWVYVWQGAADIKASKGRSSLLSVPEAEDLIDSLEFATRITNKIANGNDDKVSYIKTISTNIQIVASYSVDKFSNKSDNVIISLYCADAVIRIPTEQINSLKQYIAASKTWASNQKDDFTLFVPNPAAQ